MIDTHLHLSHQRFDRDREAVLERARAAGVVAAIEVGWDLDSSQAAISLAARHPGFLFPAAGIHPHYVGQAPPRAMETLRRLAAEAPIIAIGETGLDLYRNLSPQEQQEELFRQHVHLAREVELPLIVHSRVATERVLTILEEEGAEAVGGVLHCFSGDPDQARRATGLGFYLGVGGTLSYGDPELDTVVRETREDRLLLETDAPYLAPKPHRRERNEPARMTLVRDRIASLRSSSPLAIARQTSENAARLFRLPATRLDLNAAPITDPTRTS